MRSKTERELHQKAGCRREKQYPQAVATWRAIINREALDPNSRNGRHIMQKLRAKYGDEVIDREIGKLKQRI
jgi:hypothetical protein